MDSFSCLPLNLITRTKCTERILYCRLNSLIQEQGSGWFQNSIFRPWFLNYLFLLIFWVDLLIGGSLNIELFSVNCKLKICYSEYGLVVDWAVQTTCI